MIDMVKKVLYFDKVISAMAVLSLAMIVAIIITSVYANETKAGNDTLMRQLKEIRSLAGGVTDIKDFVESRERKIGQGKTGGVVSTMQQTLESLDMKAKTLKPLDNRKVLEYLEENVELEIDGTDLNHIVNMLYKIESSPVPIKIKNASMKTSFEDPDKFNIKIILALITKG
jgi:hypothetical protein